MAAKSFFVAASSPMRAETRRRFATVSAFARVTSFSIIGRISFAFASVVEMRSWTMSDRISDFMRAPRWFFERPSFLPL